MDELLLIDKPAGLTSHDVVDRVRKIFGTRRVGHAGTLDPFATGLLIVGVGLATKKLTALVGLDKTYEATAELSATSTTFDTEGEITQHASRNTHHFSEDEIEKALETFRGTYRQRAPLYSAKKIHGKKLYELAREGKAEESMRPEKDVTISELRIVSYAWPELKLRIRCSSGTYIRSLVDDIGRELGCGAYAKELRRTAVGSYRIEDAATLNALAAQNKRQTANS